MSHLVAIQGSLTGIYHMALVLDSKLGWIMVCIIGFDKNIYQPRELGIRSESNTWLHQDDVLHISDGVNQARKANIKMDNVVKKLNLKFNEDKTFCIAIGSVKQRRAIEEELGKEPLMCSNFETKLKDTFKWLGQTLSSGGLTESVAATVEAREGKIRGACLEIASIVNDWRSHLVGGMDTALLLWEACCVPSLLHGSGTWTDISVATVKKMNKIQSWFLRLVLQVGPGAPLASLFWDTLVLDMGLRVKKEKIILVLPFRSLQEDTLARKIYVEQKKKKMARVGFRNRSDL